MEVFREDKDNKNPNFWQNCIFMSIKVLMADSVQNFIKTLKFLTSSKIKTSANILPLKYCIKVGFEAQAGRL